MTRIGDDKDGSAHCDDSHMEELRYNFMFFPSFCAIEITLKGSKYRILGFTYRISDIGGDGDTCKYLVSYRIVYYIWKKYKFRCYILKLLDEKNWNPCIFDFEYETNLQKKNICQNTWSIYYLSFNINVSWENKIITSNHIYIINKYHG